MLIIFYNVYICSPYRLCVCVHPAAPWLLTFCVCVCDMIILIAPVRCNKYTCMYKMKRNLLISYIIYVSNSAYTFIGTKNGNNIYPLR